MVLPLLYKNGLFNGELGIAYSAINEANVESPI